MNLPLDTIICGECSEVMKGWPDGCVDLTVTSPPYDNLRDYEGYVFPFEDIANELYRVTKEGGVVVWVVGDATINGSETGTSFRQALYFKEIGFNLHDTMIYYRQPPFPSNERYNQVFEYMFVLSKDAPPVFNPIKQIKSENSFGDNVKSKTYRNTKGATKKPDKRAVARLSLAKTNILKTSDNIWYLPAGYMVGSKDIESFNHPGTYPELLAKQHIKSWSNPGMVVLDPMCGSGTTCKMATLLDRHYIGIDISEEYCELSRKRIKQATAQQRIFSHA